MERTAWHPREERKEDVYVGPQYDRVSNPIPHSRKLVVTVLGISVFIGLLAIIKIIEKPAWAFARQHAFLSAKP